MPEQVVFLFDTVTLSNFTLAGRFDILVERYAGRMATTTTVLDEVVRGIAEGYPLQDVLSATEDGTLEVLQLTPGERRRYQELLTRLGPGEASLVAVAASRSGTIATDDRVARESCSAGGVSVTGTIGILLAATRDHQITAAEADQALLRMMESGFYSPVNSISQLL